MPRYIRLFLLLCCKPMQAKTLTSIINLYMFFHQEKNDPGTETGLARHPPHATPSWPEVNPPFSPLLVGRACHPFYTPPPRPLSILILILLAIENTWLSSWLGCHPHWRIQDCYALLSQGVAIVRLWDTILKGKHHPNAKKTRTLSFRYSYSFRRFGEWLLSLWG